MINFSKEDIIYFAGLFDGEGHIGLHKEPNNSGRYIAFCLSNTDTNVLNWLEERFGGTIVSIKKSKYSRKNSYQIKFKKEEARDIIPSLIPYLIIKRKQAVLLLEYINGIERWGNKGSPVWYKEWQDDIAYEISKLNKVVN